MANLLGVEGVGWRELPPLHLRQALPVQLPSKFFLFA